MAKSQEVHTQIHAQTQTENEKVETDGLDPSTTTLSDPETPVIYKSWDLLIYETWVLGIVSTYAWNCSVRSYLLPQFRHNIGKNHLDIGSGTAFYLRKSSIPATTKLTLLDLEKPALDLGLSRCGRPDARGIQANILRPLPVRDRFDSISMYYLLHCLPASMSEKCAIFGHITRNMTAEGVVHGATILGRGVRRDGRFAAHVRRGVLKAGILHNESDNAFEFEGALRKNFGEVETRVVGSVFVFWAKGPRGGF
ncbi:S-adenosyl-L-methionine dependent methyltransferase [Aspergillus undulatus]|uniref:S-adenosyl-L-methionine dependent methyltransferase n=1 Tax=Aspergillus undulatus TaxID=1810928 RepID=UPI003CCDD531